MSGRHFDGGGREERTGYARAGRNGSRIAVSGTTAEGSEGAALYPGNAHRQTLAALQRALEAVRWAVR